ncbi:MAG: type I-C CRISPR-associated protein Cas8c/Csd1 [Clostridia bacterium]
MQQEISRGKKQVLVPRAFQMPAKVKKSSNVAANFLCDNSSYMLGVDNKENPSRTVQCFAAAKDLLFFSQSSPAAQAIVRYFETWDPTGRFPSCVAGRLPDLLKGGLDAFGTTERLRQRCRIKWRQRFKKTWNKNLGRICGDRALWTLAQLHANIKGVAGRKAVGFPCVL